MYEVHIYYYVVKAPLHWEYFSAMSTQFRYNYKARQTDRELSSETPWFQYGQSDFIHSQTHYQQVNWNANANRDKGVGEGLQSHTFMYKINVIWLSS